MHTSEAVYEALKLARERHELRRIAKTKQREQNEAFMAIRHRAASEYRQTLFDQALRIAGVDTADLAERHARDSLTVSHFLARQKSAALQSSAQVAVEQAQQAAARRAQWNRVASPEADSALSTVTTLDTALEIILNGPGTTSTAPNNNLAFTKAEVSSSGYLGGSLESGLAGVSWLFVWVPPQDGFLNATAFLALNGASAVWTSTSCIGGTCWADVTAAIELQQGDVVDSSSVSIFSDSVSAAFFESVGAVNLVNLDETDTLSYRPTRFPVTSDRPVVVTVSCELDASAISGSSELDFMSGEYRLNVPFVFLSLV